MSIELNHNTVVFDSVTECTGRLMGRFTRKGETWWTVFWSNNETTSEKESELHVG